MAARKAPRKKSTPRKKSASTKKASTRKNSTRKYGKSVGRNVEAEMRELKAGELRSGRSGKKVANPKQAIAIALDEARREGKKVPPNPNR